MKDNVENRRRIALLNKCKTAMPALREKGLSWCAHLFTYYIASTIADRTHWKMHRLRRERNLPGLNSAALNKHIWNSWDWSGQGDEWSLSEEWQQSLIRCILEPNIARDTSILEIGPGAGRWTVPLLARARDYVGVDISSACIEHCEKRFANEARAKFVVGSGRDLAGVADGSIDAIGASMSLCTSMRPKSKVTSRSSCAYYGRAALL